MDFPNITYAFVVRQNTKRPIYYRSTRSNINKLVEIVYKAEKGVICLLKNYTPALMTGVYET